MALAGLPPMNGFVSKLALVRGGIDAEAWLALGLAIGAGAITLVYMTSTWQLIFQQSPTEATVGVKDTKGDSFLAPALLISVCLFLGVYTTPLLDVAQQTVDELQDPQNYINAVQLYDIALDEVETVETEASQ